MAAPHTSRLYRPLTVLLAVAMTGVIVAGLLKPIPNLEILEHTARNLYFHVPMWFTMIAGFFTSAWFSGRALAAGRGPRLLYMDTRAEQAALVGALFGVLGLTTGMVWARFTWYVGTNLWWNFDPKQNMAAVQLLIYGAYFVLRSGVEDEVRRARLGAVYNLFAATTIPFLLFVLPRQMESLHPGAEGNPAFSDTDLAPAMRWVFYPAVVCFIGLFAWVWRQRVRLKDAERRLAGAHLPL